MDIAEEKQAQRTSGKAARRALSPEQLAAANAALCARLWQLDAVQNAQTILLYAAFGGEADLAGLAAEAARRGKVLAYPVCGENCSLTAAVPGPEGMGKGYYDRYLPRCTKAAKIGIALEVQRVAHAAVDEHDQRLDAFVTERGLYTWT